jgi:ELWxxDGT repeat protein
MGSAFPYETDLVSFDGNTYFEFDDPALGSELFRTDGTAGGTGILVDLKPGEDSSSPGRPFAGPTQLLWGANHPDDYGELMATDGVTVSRLDTNPGGSDGIEERFEGTALGSTVVFAAIGDGVGYELFATDGTPTGTGLIGDLDAAGSSSPENFGSGLGLAFFRATTADEGEEPWVTNGEAGGAMLLGDLVPGPEGSFPGSFVEAGDKVFFFANDPVAGSLLWVTDGTPAGTVQVFDLDTDGPGGSNFPGDPDEPSVKLMAVGARVVFVAGNAAFGDELMISDGTPAGTLLLRDINPGPASSDPTDLTKVGDRVYFIADDGEHGPELWVTDGTSGGTRLVWDVNPGPSGSDLENLTAADRDTLYFTANDSVIGNELFRYSTRVFADGFESSDTTSWSLTNE